MATLMNNTSGNFTSATVWSLVDATSFLNSQAASTNLTTTFVSSATFIPGPITIDGIAVKVASRIASPSGTVSVRIFNNTLVAAVAGTTVTINLTDINVIGGGWYFFKFAAPVLLIGATSYSVQASSSVTNQMALYRSATAGDWSRALRTTTTQAAAASDTLLINGEYTAAATNASYTVTMDNTSTTSFGAVELSTKGTLTWGTTAATNYYLKLGGNLNIYSGGTYNMGTSGTPIPSSSTASLEFNCTVNGEFGVECGLGSVFNAYGATKTVKALLAADASAGATSLTTNVSTGWVTGDVIAIASTTRTASEAEHKSLTGNAAGTTLTIAALTNAHTGTLAIIRAELANLTRNVKIFGTTTLLQGYFNTSLSTIVNAQYVEFYNMGSATNNKRGIDIVTTTGSASFQFCSLHDFTVASSIGFVLSNNYNNVTLNNNVLYLIANNSINSQASSGTIITITNNLAIKNLTGSGIAISDLAGTITGNTSTSSASVGFLLSDLAFNGTVSGNTAHSNAGNGINITNVTGTGSSFYTLMDTFNAWYNVGSGLSFANSFNLNINSFTAFGNSVSNISNSSHMARNLISNSIFNSGSPLACPIGLSLASDQSEIIYDNCTFGLTTTHATADVSVPSANTYTEVLFRNCLFNSTNKIINVNSNSIDGTEVRSARHQQTAGNHITFKRFGTVMPDTTIFNRASPSARLTPNSATKKLSDATKRVAVANGQSAVISTFIRKSVIGDGTAYNGNQPRLILKANPAIGQNSDTVLATSTNAANGAFEQLVATTPVITDNAVFEFEIDCDGTTGWINVDDWRVM